MNPDYYPGQQLECTIIDGGDKDQCFGRLENGPGVFVRGRSVPGDRVRFEITRVHKRYLDACLVEVLTPSPNRTEAPCPYFSECGGCKWQNFSYVAECALKHEQITRVLHHVGRFTDIPVHPVIPSPDQYHSRNRITLSFSQSDNAPLQTGYHAVSDAGRLIDIEQCLHASPPMNRALQEVRSWLQTLEKAGSDCGLLHKLIIQQSASHNALMVNLVTRGSFAKPMQTLIPRLEAGLAGFPFSLINTISLEETPPEPVVLHGPGFLTEQLGPFHFEIPPNRFFQVNTPQAVALAQTATTLAAPEPGQHLVELFSGMGTLSLFLARGVSQFEGYEGDRQAVETARQNAVHNGLPHARFSVMNLHHGRALQKRWAGRKPDIIVTDPPRTGMTPGLIEALQSTHPRRLVYVSCNPATFARDAKMLCEAGTLQLREVHPVDMFPRTAHVELVGLFSCG